jgi:hypothetical protein
MISRRTGTRLATWAGLWVAALLWAVNTQLGEILPVSDCTRAYRISATVSLILTALALLAGWISWRSTRAQPAGFGSPRTLRFAAALSALSALIFAFTLAMQAAAALVLSGCER